MTEFLEGSCLCGCVRFHLKGSLSGFFLCHCSRCQKASGSAHGANLFAKDAQLDWLAGCEKITEFQVPDSRHERSFCSSCGSPLPHFNKTIGMWQIPAGSLDTAIDKAPDAKIFMTSQPDWVRLSRDVPCFEHLPE